jgi:dTDP-4-dehydrorhamnose reductase
MLKLAVERSELSVVEDEVGNPTYAPDIALAISQLIQYPVYGTYHFVNEGYCSRYEFAREIFRQAGRTDINVRPIKLAEYKRDSSPPPFTPLRNFAGATSLGIKLQPWQEALQTFLKTVTHTQQ